MTEEREKILRFIASSPDIYGITAPITEELFKEIDDLRWFRDQVNSRVLPGVMDTQESTYELIQRLRKALEEIRDSQEPWEPQRTIAIKALENC